MSDDKVNYSIHVTENQISVTSPIPLSEVGEVLEFMRRLGCKRLSEDPAVDDTVSLYSRRDCDDSKNVPSMPWKPLDTAPKDGTTIVVCAEEDGKWVLDLVEWDEDSKYFANWFSHNSFKDGYWMPVPDTPY